MYCLLDHLQTCEVKLLFLKRKASSDAAALYEWSLSSKLCAGFQSGAGCFKPSLPSSLAQAEQHRSNYCIHNVLVRIIN